MIDEDVSRAVASEIAIVRAQADLLRGPLRAIGLAVPTRVVGPEGDASSTRQEIVFSAFTPPPGVALVLENNVNCAAVAEGYYGAARGAPSFAYVQIGLRIGMGLVFNGRLVRGRNGAAGEIGHLSFPFGPGLEPKAGEAERYLGAEAFIARARSDWSRNSGTPPQNIAELLAMAELGNVDAVRHLTSQASAIGAIVASCVSVVDPGLIILGGGLGASPLILPVVLETAWRLSYPVEIRSTLLGTDASVLGIERLTIEAVVSEIVGS